MRKFEKYPPEVAQKLSPKGKNIKYMRRYFTNIINFNYSLWPDHDFFSLIQIFLLVDCNIGPERLTCASFVLQTLGPMHYSKIKIAVAINQTIWGL